MGLTKVFGAILLVLSTMWGIVTLFVFLNSSAYLDYNTGSTARVMEKMSQQGILIPLIICIFAWIMGFLLARDRVLSDH